MNTSIIKIYNSLTAEQKQFVDSKKVNSTQKIKKWIDLFRPIAQMDKLNDTKRKRKSVWLWVLGISSFFLLFFSIGFPLLLIAVLILVLIFIIQFRKLNALNKIDIGNHLRLFLMPFLVVMKEESEEDAKASLVFDAMPSTNQKFFVKQINNNNKGYPKIITSLYNHPWLETEMLLADGTAIQIEIIDFVARKDITKRGSSGKVKSKVKFKIKHNVKLRVNFSKSRYNLDKTNELFQIIDSDNFYQLKTKQKIITLSAEESLPLNGVLSLISSAYKNVKAI
ncbi:MAG: hypothetical protein U0W24_24690 [Bacteroidales bacterium]